MGFSIYLQPFVSVLPSSFQLAFAGAISLVIIFFFLSFVLWIIRIIRGG